MRWSDEHLNVRNGSKADATPVSLLGGKQTFADVWFGLPYMHVCPHVRAILRNNAIPRNNTYCDKASQLLQ